MSQPLPTAGRESVPEHTLANFRSGLAEQNRKGIAKYGSGLMTWNGRDAGVDAWEELIDLAQYLTQLRLERADLIEENRQLRAENDRLRSEFGVCQP